ncbi:TetR family transcriptional regulator C-terminal domain-containing protein [Amycolatopsis sp. NPDC052450]|uniref:TetR family transcriptional regulator C-terminal domain-containing protein n=1 Tax=Amycolatopsis sp. NPDC052450 TaxID=3363937 RepID=UPI0037C5F4E4
MVAEVAEVVRRVHDTDVAAEDAAERLTSLVEGLSERWFSGSMELDRARSLLRDAVALELDRVGAWWDSRRSSASCVTTSPSGASTASPWRRTAS